MVSFSLKDLRLSSSQNPLTQGHCHMCTRRHDHLDSGTMHSIIIEFDAFGNFRTPQFFPRPTRVLYGCIKEQASSYLLTH